ncbi:MAG: hypothetical protein ACK4GC_07870 [Paracoccaceae bacterium]
MTDQPKPRSGWPFALIGTLSLIAGIWVLSDLGYYYGLPALSYETNYNHDPIAAATYYLFWVGVAVITFSRTCASWRSVSQWEMFENRPLSLVLWSVFFALAITFTAYILPGLPPFQWQPEWGPVPDLPQAKPTYFLPKSFDILFQQILILALVLSLAQEGYSLRRISLVCGALFGAVHLLLIFDAPSVSYVLRFAVVATLFGLIFPVLILRVRNGLAYSFALHWFYYALTVFMARAIGPEAVWPTVQKALGLG